MAGVVFGSEAQDGLRPQLEQGAEGASDVHPEWAREAGDVGLQDVDAGVVVAVEAGSAGQPGPLAREELVGGGFLRVRGEEVGARGELHQPVLDGGALLLVWALSAWFDGDADMAVRGHQVAQARVGHLLPILVLEENELRGAGQGFLWRRRVHPHQAVCWLLPRPGKDR
jgi:hypothetical protein